MLSHCKIWVISCCIALLSRLVVQCIGILYLTSKSKIPFSHPILLQLLWISLTKSGFSQCSMLRLVVVTPHWWPWITLEKDVSAPTYLSFGPLCIIFPHTFRAIIINSSIDLLTCHKATFLVETCSPSTYVVSNILVAAVDIGFKPFLPFQLLCKIMEVTHNTPSIVP